jgi:hypothetical protein
MTTALVAIFLVSAIAYGGVEVWSRRRWRMTSRVRRKGVELCVAKGRETVCLARVRFDRVKTPNPDVSFAEQLATARARVRVRRDELNGHERRVREINRRWRRR